MALRLDLKAQERCLDGLEGRWGDIEVLVREALCYRTQMAVDHSEVAVTVVLHLDLGCRIDRALAEVVAHLEGVAHLEAGTRTVPGEDDHIEVVPWMPLARIRSPGGL